MEVRSKATCSCSKTLGVGSGIYRALMWKEKRVWKTGLKVSQVTTSGFQPYWNILLPGDSVSSIGIEFIEDFLGQTLLVFPPGCNHTQTLYCLPTCLGKMPDDCSIHACFWFSGKPSKIHPYWTKTWSSYWSWKRKKPKFILNLSAICTKITSFWSLHSTAFLMDACERRKQTWSTDIFVKCLHWFHCHTAMGTYGL